MERLGSLILGVGIGLFVGIALPILYIWWIIYNIRGIQKLSTSGTQVIATVTRVITREVKSYVYIYESHSFRRDAPKKIHHLITRWQDPQTGKTYTLKGFVKNPDKFPVGSSVHFLINAQHPKWHRQENMLDV
jgi:hypothetical protein